MSTVFTSSYSLGIS